MKAILDLVMEMELSDEKDLKPIEKMVAKVRIRIARHGNRLAGSAHADSDIHKTDEQRR